MATFTTYANGDVISLGAGGNAAGFPMPTVMEAVFDASRRNLAAADVVELLKIPKGTFVQKVFFEVLGADPAQTVHIGDAADPDGYVASGDVATAGAVAMGAGAFAAGKFYADEATLDLTVPATMALDTLKIKVYVACIPLGVAG